MNESSLRIVVLLLLASVPAARGQSSPPATAQGAPAVDALGIFRTVEAPTFTSEKAARVKDLTLTRDRIQITLTDGVIGFAQPVAGHTFAAVFRGTGRIHLEPPNEREKQQLRFFTNRDSLDTTFSDAVFSFTDGTFDEIAAKAQWDTAAADPLFPKTYQERTEFRESYGGELVPRIVKGLLSENKNETALFYADVKVPERGWIFAEMDALDPEEIELGRWLAYGPYHLTDQWVHFPRSGRSSAEAWKDPVAREDVLPENYQISATVTSGADLQAHTVVELKARWSGERVLQFFLDSNARVSSVKDKASGQPLPFVQPQEQKDRLQAYGRYVSVFMPAPIEAGMTYTLEFDYAGKRIVRSLGPGVFFCQSFGWYPGRDNFAMRSNFDITFRSPKRYALVATGMKVSETTDGSDLVSNWKSEKPIAVAGFAYGEVKIEKVKLGDIDVEVYANKQPDDQMKAILRYTEGGGGTAMVQSSAERERTGYALGNLSPAEMVGQIASNTANAIQVFQNYFGPYPYKHLAVSTIPFSYGQGWPSLLYLSALTFLDTGQRHQLGISARGEKEITDFFRAHETSHQWWGHKVAWKSYHDQWLSEGFAEFSGNLYLQINQGAGGAKEYMDRIRQAKLHLESKNEKGHTYDSIGPIWMGLRLRSSEAFGGNTGPDGYSELVYEKGGYVLHMLRMMLFDPQNKNPEQRFKEMMHDFTQTYDNQAASTEDFKAIVDKHMTDAMDLESNHRMDWLFRQYVYGTGIPQYQFHYDVQDAGGGQFKISGTLSRSGVPDDWKDIVPVYLHRGSGAVRMGFINAIQPKTTFEFTLPFRPDKLTLNDNEDILADIKQ